MPDGFELDDDISDMEDYQEGDDSEEEEEKEEEEKPKSKKTSSGSKRKRRERITVDDLLDEPAPEKLLKN